MYTEPPEVNKSTKAVYYLVSSPSLWRKVLDTFVFAHRSKRLLGYVLMLISTLGIAVGLQVFMQTKSVDRLFVGIDKLESELYHYQQSSQSRKNYLNKIQNLSINNAMALVDDISTATGSNTLRVEALGGQSSGFIFEASGSTQAIVAWLSDSRLDNRVFVSRMRLSRERAQDPLILYSLLRTLE